MLSAKVFSSPQQDLSKQELTAAYQGKQDKDDFTSKPFVPFTSIHFCLKNKELNFKCDVISIIGLSDRGS